MSKDLRREVQDLCCAACELLTVFDLQQAQAEAARRRAETSRAAFDRLMESYRSGEVRPSGAERSRTLLEALGTGASTVDAHEELLETAELGRRWEAGFCDLYESLIRLNAHPEVRAGVERITEQVRSIRLLQIWQDEMDPDLLPDPAESFGGLPELREEWTPGAYRRERADRMGAFVGGMDGYLSQVTDSAAARTQSTRQQLEALLAAAEALG